MLKDKNGKCIFVPTGGGLLEEQGVYAGACIVFNLQRCKRDFRKNTLFKLWFPILSHRRWKINKERYWFNKGHIIRVPKDNIDQVTVYIIMVDFVK